MAMRRRRTPDYPVIRDIGLSFFVNLPGFLDQDTLSNSPSPGLFRDLIGNMRQDFSVNLPSARTRKPTTPTCWLAVDKAVLLGCRVSLPDRLGGVVLLPRFKLTEIDAKCGLVAHDRFSTSRS